MIKKLGIAFFALLFLVHMILPLIFGYKYLTKAVDLWRIEQLERQLDFG